MKDKSSQAKLDCKFDPPGIKIQKSMIEQYLLCFQLKGNFRLKQKRGIDYFQKYTKITYMCADHNDCPFEMTRKDYKDDKYNNYTFIEIQSPHVHTENSAKKFSCLQLHTEITQYLSQLPHNMKVSEIYQSVSDYVTKCYNLNDVIGQYHMKKYPNIVLFQSIALILENVLPSKNSLYKRKSYYKKQNTLFGFKDGQEDNKQQQLIKQMTSIEQKTDTKQQYQQQQQQDMMQISTLLQQ